MLRPGWANGNTVALIITGNGQRVADSFDGAFAPVLHVVYSTGGPPPNQRPVVSAGPDQTVTMPAAANLAGSVADDGLPNPPGAVVNTWTKVSGPGTATFADPNAAATSAAFDLAGTYVLRLSSSDSLLTGIDDVTVTAPRTREPGVTRLPDHDRFRRRRATREHQSQHHEQRSRHDVGRHRGAVRRRPPIHRRHPPAGRGDRQCVGAVPLRRGAFGRDVIADPGTGGRQRTDVHHGEEQHHVAGAHRRERRRGTPRRG